LLAAGYGQAGPQQAGYGKPQGQPGYDSGSGYGMQGDPGGAGYGQHGSDRSDTGTTCHCFCYSAPNEGSEYCDDCVCVSVFTCMCVSVCLSSSVRACVCVNPSLDS